jgi:CheY-like chemotaxis protein
MEAVGQLAGGVAHDFNNLLTVISGYSDMIMGELPPGQNLEDLKQIKDAAANAGALTGQLLAFSRRQVLEPRVLGLNGIVEGGQKMLRLLIPENIHMRTALAPDLRHVRADPGQIEQVLMNLIINARDAMPSGGTITIETANVDLDTMYAAEYGTVHPGQYAMLAVSDTGMGMSEEIRSRVFEPFFTTKAVGLGTGLGLATVYGIVKQSGGNIWVYSEPGQGTTFKIYLPITESALEPVSEVPIRSDTSGVETVLLVEDADAVRRMSRDALRHRGYVVLEASNGSAALALAAEHGGRIDLLLSDVVMPGMGGRELADQLVQLRPEMKVLFVSGYTDDTLLQQGTLGPGIHLLQKPFTPLSLARRVRQVLDSA